MVRLTGRRAVAFTASLALWGCGGSSGGTADAGPQNDKLNETFKAPFTRTTPNKPGSIQVSFSGEKLGVEGLPFQPATQGDPVFVDGWSLEFEEYLIVVGNVRLSPNATKYPEQSRLDAPVAVKKGPFVMDIHKPRGLTGADGESPAGAMFLWETQDNGQPFDTGTRYAFSYDVVKASYPGTQVNLSQSQFADYDQMVQNGWSKFVVGKATYVGKGTHPDTAAQAKFDALPKSVRFSFGWNDSGGVLNCVNASFGDGESLENRGVQPTESGAVTAQITAHVDHLFWDKLKVEGTPLRFDPIAAWAPADTETTPLSINSLKDKPLTVTFADGTALPDRAPYQNVPGGYVSDQVNPAQVNLDLSGIPAANIKGLADFMAFNAQAQMHLNADGLCYAVGQQQSDPYYVPNVQ